MTAEAIVRALLETDEPDPSELAASLEPHKTKLYSLSEIKALVPEFFSRSNTRQFGTKKVWLRQPGNHIVLQNTNRDRHNTANTDYVVYQLVFYGPDGRSADLMWRGSFKLREWATDFARKHAANPHLTEKEWHDQYMERLNPAE